MGWTNSSKDTRSVGEPIHKQVWVTSKPVHITHKSVMISARLLWGFFAQPLSFPDSPLLTSLQSHAPRPPHPLWYEVLWLCGQGLSTLDVLPSFLEGYQGGTTLIDILESGAGRNGWEPTLASVAG